MQKIWFVLLLISSLWVRAGAVAWSQEVPYTLEDRDRLIRVETALKEFKDSMDQRFEQMDKRFAEFQSGVGNRFEQIDKRFEQVDKRFEQLLTFLWILASVFGGLVAATISFAVWDRRTALAPALRRSRDVEEREERIERALRELAQKDPNVAEVLRHVGLL